MSEQQDKRYVVEYRLPYVHTVQVGIEAPSPEAAKRKAEVLFDAGEIWDNTEAVPLLYDDFDETGDAGVPLTFTIPQELAIDEPWPEPAACVQEIVRREAAFEACWLLIDAYRRGEECCGSIDWSDLDQAYQAALRAAGTSAGRVSMSGRLCKRLAIVIEDGTVRAIEADQPDAAPSVAVIEYDTAGFESDELCQITQADGSRVNALVIECGVGLPSIDLDEVFLQEKGAAS